MKNTLLNITPDLTLFSTIIGTLLLGKLFSEPLLFPVPMNSILGTILIIGGIGLSVAILAFIIRHEGSTDVVKTSERLIVSKYFSISRNPLYLAEFIVVIGVAILAGSLIAFVGPLIYILVLNFAVIPYEEKRLELAFGKAYLRYKQSVRRWI